jgi:hypothetical protein
LAFYKNVASSEVAYIYKICYHTSFQDTKIVGADVASASQVHTSTVVLLLIVKNGTYGFQIASGGITSVQSFMKIREMVQKLKSDTQHSDLVTLHIFLRL